MTFAMIHPDVQLDYAVVAVGLLCPVWCGSAWVPSNVAMDQAKNDRSMCGNLEVKYG